MTEVRWRQLHGIKGSDLEEGQFVLFPASNPEVLVCVGDKGDHNLRRLSDNAELYIHPFQEAILLEKMKVEAEAPTSSGDVVVYVVAAITLAVVFWLLYAAVSTLPGAP